MTSEKPNQLIELSSPSGERGVYICAKCYEYGKRPGEYSTPIRDGRGEEFCQVYRGLSSVYAGCMSPDHGKFDGPVDVIATWSEDDQEYQVVIGGIPLWSDDGDNWMPSGPHTKLPDAFHSAKITLSGGERDGEEVM